MMCWMALYFQFVSYVRPCVLKDSFHIIQCIDRSEGVVLYKLILTLTLAYSFSCGHIISKLDFDEI